MDETPIVDIISFGNNRLRDITLRLKRRTRNLWKGKCKTKAREDKEDDKVRVF
jgi:hypothetical protein